MQTQGITSSSQAVATAQESPPKATKIIVAIHGIGDQYRNATIQSVVSSFGHFVGYTAAMPLGRLGTGDGKNIFFLKGPPPPTAPLDTIAFVEFYWADIPRKVQTEGYRIEETKAWARTVVERLRARYQYFREEARKHSGTAPSQADSDLAVELHREDFSAAADAIEEMIETFAVLDHLLFVVEKAGLLKFNLNDLLISYVGDVQIVADFPDQRRLILDQFSRILYDVAVDHPNAEIHVIAHSEGTVVAFMGLLEAMASQPRANGKPAAEPPAWVGQVRGLMTIGSPIDKHLILWPDIWDDLQEHHPKVEELRRNKIIQWRNYYDYGDPVGFRLETARDWLCDHKWKPFFEFEPPTKQIPHGHDYGFSRYLFPGAAHIDYWGDEDVFGHFIETVVFKPEKTRGFSEPPQSKLLAKHGSRVIPYIVVYLLIFLGVYLLYKGAVEYLFPVDRQPEPVPQIRHFGFNVAGISALMMGMIALARIPRLTRRWTMWALAILCFGAGAALYAWLVEPVIKRWHAWNMFDSSWIAGAFVIGAASSVVALSAWASRRKLSEWRTWPLSWLRPLLAGTRALMILGSVCVLGTVAFHVITNPEKNPNHLPPLWPLLLSSAAFFYLWWLAILIFDLVFVWHRYIRGAISQRYLAELRRKAKGTDVSGARTDESKRHVSVASS